MKHLGFIIVLVVIAVSTAAFTSTELISVNLNKVNLKVPKDFYKMNDDDIVKSFGMTNIPLAVFTNQERDIFISVNEKIDSLTRSKKIKYKASNPEYQQDLEMYKMFQKSGLLNMYSDVKIFREDLVINEKEKYLIFEFNSNAVGVDKNGVETNEQHYNIIKHVFIKNRTYIVNFGCPLAKKEEWKSTANEIIISAEPK